VLRRLAVYFVTMFPPWVMVPMSAVHFLAIELGLQALSGREPLVLSWRSAAGTAGIFLFSLVLRVQDELKDLETDLRLAKAGDPRYATRPIVTGKVLASDLVWLRRGALALLVALSALLGKEALLALAVVGTLVVLSFHWFFVPSMRERLLLAFATHNPLAAAISGWAVAVCAEEAPVLSSWALVLVLGLWLPVAAWEIARKVRAPADETDYTTYSKILGARTAGALPAVFVAVATAALAAFAARVGAPFAYFPLLGGAALFAIGSSLAFALAPSTKRANLRPSTELFGAVAGGGLAVALAFGHGVAR
jgi:4-hydroxybenzoate polyprenyltransferase